MNTTPDRGMCGFLCLLPWRQCRAGADRLELCAHLVIGGTTPTHALFRQVQRGSGVPDQCPDPPALRRFSL